jgi:uncharacterized protein (DUF2141 family)
VALVGSAALVIVAGLILAANGADSPTRVDGAARAADGDASSVVAPRVVARPEAQPPPDDPVEGGLIRFRLKTNHEGGSVYCGLFAADSWPGLPVQFDIEPVEAESVVCEFDNVPRGEYAAAAFHDQNGNDTLDLNWFGMPEEEWTFSRNVRRLLPLPQFEDIKFDFGGDRKTVDAELE